MVAAILCNEGTSWLPSKYSHRNKNLIPLFWTNVTPLLKGHFITV